MSTTLYLRDTVSSLTVTGYTTVLDLTTTQGNGFNNIQVATTASGNHIEFPTGSSKTCWAMQVGAVTISGSISLNLWGNENAMATNARLAVRIARYDSTGTFVSDIVANGNANHPDDVELGTSTAAMTWSATPTSTSLSNNDILVIVPHADNIGTMAVGSVTLSYDASSGGVQGDTFATFTETITGPTASATSLLIPHRHRNYIIR